MRSRAFSLLEVMVALAIFGLMITGILAAQGGLAASNKKAANMGLAANLARCKMTELEEKLLKLGYPEIDDLDQGAICCEGEESSTFSCDTRIERVTMPDPPTSTLGDIMGADGGGLLNNNPALGSGQLDFDGGLSGLGTQLQGITGQPTTGAQGTAGLLNMALGFMYPTLKPMMEASIRRISVNVHWKEGNQPQELQIVQFVTNPQRGGFIAGMPGSDGGAPTTGGAGAAATGAVNLGGTPTTGGGPAGALTAGPVR
jgi:general secretion pathway protein I